MIKLKRQRELIPQKYQGAKFLALMEKLLIGYYEFNYDVPFNTQKSRFQQWKDAKPALMQESHGKCAYCESPTNIVTYGDVEHFRPKDLYWWLAFSYDNYTYSCQLCNQKFKGANFTIAGTRTIPPVPLPRTRPSPPKLKALSSQICLDPINNNDSALLSYFKSEKADLPHPYLDDPEKIFSWEVDNINREVSLVSNGTTANRKRALKAAEDLLGLNREELRRARYAQYSMIYAHSLVIQESSQSSIRNISLQALTASADAQMPYAAMTRYFLRQWNLMD
jgi:5-methylcytosine-specific restriction endonuclease McrA